MMHIKQNIIFSVEQDKEIVEKVEYLNSTFKYDTTEIIFLPVPERRPGMPTPGYPTT